jgi:hypothetical protein
LCEAGQRGRDEHLGDTATEAVEQDSNVLVLVCVDTDNDIVTS